MNSEWRKTSLGAICKFTAGSAFKPQYQGSVSGDYPFIKVSDMNIAGNELFINEAQNYVSEIQRAAMKAKLHPVGATVFAKIGVALTTNRRRLLTRPTLVDNNMMSATPKNGEVTSRFLYLLLTSLDFNTISAGTALPYLNVSDLEKIEISLPSDLAEQKVIERVAGALDDKIDLNRRINQTLEAMANAVFKSWFVDFDPVKAKIAAIQKGCDPMRAAMSAISGKPDAELDALPPEQYEQLAATAVLFPDEMVESELGEMPRGGTVQRVGNVLELVYGKALKSTDRQEGNVPVYGSGGITGFHNTPLVTHGSIIVGRKGTVGSLYWEDDPFFPIDTTYYIRPMAAPLTFCYYTMKTLGLEKMNTDAAVPGLNRENVCRLELVLPDSATLQQFDLIATTLRKAIRTNSDENKSLADLRDTLLPKLLSGELSVTEAAEGVEAWRDPVMPSDDVATQHPSDYFEKIPLWSANDGTKRFEIMADAVSGRLPVTRLESWRDFTDLLESNFFNENGVQLVFRGHRRYDWSLMPTLGRLTTNGIVTKQLAREQLERFKRAVRGRLNDATMVDEDDELWSVGQHHGLMTPLLDWTYSPYVALFFAFDKGDSKEEADNRYRAVYVLNKSFLAENEDKTGIRFWEPRRDDHGRLVNQAGLFTFSPPDVTIENKLGTFLTDDEWFKDEKLLAASEDEQPDILARYICKIYIRNEERDACLRHLRRMNVHHASLFPDLLGASKYCNVIATEAEIDAAVQRCGKHHEITITDSVTVTDQLDVEVPPSPVSTDTLASIKDALRQPAGAEQVEPGRIALMAEELATSIAKNKVVDWETRDAVQARLRNVVRVVLRKYGYPQGLREQVVEQVLRLAKLADGENSK